MTDLGRRTGGVAAVVAAFWLGFVCGGGGGLPGAAAVGGPSGQPPRSLAGRASTPAEPSQADPASAEPSQQTDPAPAEPSQGDPTPAQPSQQTDPAPAEPSQGGPTPAAPADPTQADPASAEPEQDADPAEPAQADPAPAEPEQDADPADPTQADPAPADPTQADPALEEAEQDAEAEAPPGPEPPVVQDRPREFTARAGMVLYFVRQDAESAYEETMARVAEAFAVSESDEREEQAEGWRVYKAEEPLADGVRLYVSWVDPVVPGADYWVPAILSEAFPTEAQSLYETYAGAFADGQILLNLVPVAGP